MATLQILTPPVTPGYDKIRAPNNKNPRYKKIRFKNWQPETPKQERKSPIPGKTLAREKKSPPGVESPESRSSDSELDSIIRSAIPSRYASPLQVLPVSGTRMDPFNELPIKAEGVVLATLDYFISICAPADKETFTVVGYENPHMSMLFPFMCQHALLFESIIALCRASILMCVGKSASEDKAFIYHRARAIKGVSEALSTDEATSDAILLSVAMLLTLEYLVGNIAAVAAHRQGLQRMIDMRNDLEDTTPWNKFVKAGLEAYKNLGSFVTGEPPEVSSDSHGFIHETFAGLSLDKPIVYPSVPFPPDLCTILSRLPSGFSELSLSGRLSTQTMQVLASLSATTTYCESEFFDDTRLDSQLQAMLSALQRLSLMKIAMTEKYLTCGLVAYAFQLRHLRALNLFHDPPLRTFIKLIPNQEKPDSEREQNCMIWVSMAVAGALNLRTICMPGTHLVLDRLFDLYPSTLTWSNLETRLRSYFHTPSILEHWRKCHDTGVNRWKQVTRARQAVPLIDLEGVSDRSLEKEDNLPRISFEQMQEHTRGAPGAMIDMMQAAKCPFQARMKKMGYMEPMLNPHG